MDWSKPTSLPARVSALPGRVARHLRSFARLDGPQRALLVRAALLLGKHRLGLWLFSFRMPAPASPVVAPSLARDRPPSPGTIGWAVNAASRLVPGSTCLVRALAAHSLCLRYGYPATVRLGARRDQAGDLEAHAWLELGGEVVVGGGEARAEYSVFRPRGEDD